MNFPTEITVRLTVQASRITLVVHMHVMDGNPSRGTIILINRDGKRPSPISQSQHCSPGFIPGRYGMAQVTGTYSLSRCIGSFRLYLFCVFVNDTK